MDFQSKQIAPPRDWTTFEDLCRALFSAVWGDPYAQKHGRTGQPQHGVDVWVTAAGRVPGIHGVQCKGKDSAYHGQVSTAEFDSELAKAENFSPKCAYWLLATTAPNDATIQRHAREVSSAREAAGKFPVTILGWQTLVALMAEHPKVIEQFYPEHASQMDALRASLDQLPGRGQIAKILDELRALRDRSPQAAPVWQPVQFDGERGLGPALLGRALGPGDARQCPLLPEAAALVADLKASHSARLTGIPGAGKSVCALQAAQMLASEGYRVVRLLDPRAVPIELMNDAPTLHLIDDAHLMQPQMLAAAEHSATSSSLLLSTHTSVDERDAAPGTIHLDTKRAVRIIASDLRARRADTFEAVRKIDDRIGDAPGDESLEQRLDAAEQAELPWQFCFILSGGWRRTGTIGASARAVGADIALAAIAIRQLATRDARADTTKLEPLFAAAGIESQDAANAISWLAGQRIVNSKADLRCPHQRFSAAVLGAILDGQDKEGRRRIARIMAHVLSDPAMPLSGLSSVITEWRMTGSGAGWAYLIEADWLAPFVARCWSAETADDIAAASYALREIDSYLPSWMRRVPRAQVETLARWFSDPQPKSAYAIGHFINGTYRNRRFGRRIIRASDPEAVADALNAAQPDFACEIAEMVRQAGGELTPEWTVRYLARIDRAKCQNLVATWPPAERLYAVADFCAHFTYLDEPFGLDLIEALIPAVADRMRNDPVEAFASLEDIFWSSIKVYDPLQIYVGRRAPTARMRELATMLCAVWDPEALAAKLSRTDTRRFQKAAGLLNVLRKSRIEAYRETVAAIDWTAVEETIGALWSRPPHDFETFLAMCHASKVGRKDVAAMVLRHVDAMETMSTRLAYLAPEAARSLVDRGGKVAICQHGHAKWGLAAAVLVDFHRHRPDLWDKLLAPHLVPSAKPLSEASPVGFEHALLFCRILKQLDPEALDVILANVDPQTAERGWANALQGIGNYHERGSRRAAREAVAWLIHHAREREEATGALARCLVERFPELSVPAPKTLEPITGLGIQ